jgi:hypothetical protein
MGDASQRSVLTGAILGHLNDLISDIISGLHLHAGVGGGLAAGCEPGCGTDLVVGEKVEYCSQTSVKIVE